jgi:transcriptional regulator with XRE-family HTH domain
MKERSIQRFGEKLHTLRTRQNLTLKELAQLLGHTAHGYISELEAGKKLPSVELVLSIARFFNVSTDQLLKDELELEVSNAGRTLGSDSTGTARKAGNHTEHNIS